MAACTSASDGSAESHPSLSVLPGNSGEGTDWVVKELSGVPGAKSEISGLNFFSEFQDIFVGSTKPKTREMHTFLCTQKLVMQINTWNDELSQSNTVLDTQRQ